MVFDAIGGHDVANLVTPRNEDVSDELPMATTRRDLGAHHCGGTLFCTRNDALQSRPESGRVHVVGVTLEPLDPPRRVRRIGSWGPPASHLGLVNIVDPSRLERDRQSFTNKVGMPPRGRKAAHVH